MSKHVNFETVCSEYDNQFTAAGSDIILGMIQTYTGKQLKDVDVLDAGCGTGNYAKAQLDAGIGSVTLLDCSPGMLDKARTKLANNVNADRIKAFVETKLPQLPFHDSCFDAVLFNMVLHHIGRRGDGTFPEATAALCEARRVLRPGGLIVIGTFLPSTITHAVWFSKFNRAFTDRINDLMPSVDEFDVMFDRAKLKSCQKLNILGTDFISEFNRFDGPLDAKWRHAVSCWLLATDTEVEEIKNTIIQMKQAGTLEAWCRKHDNTSTTGLLTLLFCQAE